LPPPPTIQAVMKHAAISSAHAKQFVRVAAMADQYDLSHEQKQYALVKELHGERIGMGAKVVSIRRWTGDRG
jgi:hypothetical protein